MKRVIYILFVFFICSNLKSQNNCLHFDGDNDFVQFSGFALQSDFTISYWFKAAENENFGNDDRILASGPGIRFEIGVADFDCESGFGWLFEQETGGVLCMQIDMRDGEWHHMAMTISGNTRSIYYDGDFIGSYSGFSDVVYGENFRMGQWTGGSSASTYYKGYLDEVRVWDYALHPDSIVATMNCELTGNEEGLLAYWNFNQGISEEDNSDIIELMDLTKFEVHGEIRNFALNGSTSNFVETGAPVEGICGVTSSSDQLEESIAISPNPSNGKFTIDAPNIENGRLEIIRLDGSLLLAQNFNVQSTVDISDQNPGIYLVKLLNGKKRLTYKIVKL